MISRSTDGVGEAARSSRVKQHLYAALAAVVIFAAIEVCQADTSLFLWAFVVAPILLVSTIFLAIDAAVSRRNRRRSLQHLTTLAILWVVGAAFFYVSDLRFPTAIRSTARWLVRSQGYKTQVLAQPSSPTGDLKHIEWDGWGMFNQDTVVYLVYDPADSLAAAAKSRQPGKFDGLPCEVPLVRRLESHWYTAQYYTDQTWDSCN